MINTLRAHLLEFAPHGIALAYSGGVDSTFLLKVLADLAQEYHFVLLPLIAHTPFQSDDEIESACAQARQFGYQCQVFERDPLALPGLDNNPPDRCYWCKRAIFEQFRDYAQKHGAMTLMDGSNADDQQVYRPGRRAIQELGVHSPLAALKITKAQIRACAAELGLDCAHKPSSPCLATRFDYGTHLTRELLQRVSDGEKIIRASLPSDADIRLRMTNHNDTARIEIAPQYFSQLLAHRAESSAQLHRLGFKFITLDLDGYRSGCYDPKGN
jgi:pyridinium-3,5-biscarboxylic acid mononucleotide sulfurtransferase